MDRKARVRRQPSHPDPLKYPLPSIAERDAPLTRSLLTVLRQPSSSVHDQGTKRERYRMYLFPQPDNYLTNLMYA
jgi:hypothetical protein